MRSAPSSSFVGFTSQVLRACRPKLRSHLDRSLHTAVPLIGDASIWTKTSAASAILLLCLIGLGINAYFTLERSSTNLLHYSEIELPKQRAVSELAGDIVTTHLKIFRFVTWMQMGVGADNGEIL